MTEYTVQSPNQHGAMENYFLDDNFEDFYSQEGEDYTDSEDEYVSEADEENASDPEALPSMTWTDPATRILLQIVSKNEAHRKLERHRRNAEFKRALWYDLILQFKAHPDFQNLDTVFKESIDGKEGASQYKALVKKYISFSDSILNERIKGPVEWVFFDTLKRILINDPTIHPPAITSIGCLPGPYSTRIYPNGRIVKEYFTVNGPSRYVVLSEAFDDDDTADTVSNGNEDGEDGNASDSTNDGSVTGASTSYNTNDNSDAETSTSLRNDDSYYTTMFDYFFESRREAVERANTATEEILTRFQTLKRAREEEMTEFLERQERRSQETLRRSREIEERMIAATEKLRDSIQPRNNIN